jgi:hypothetical protein
VKRKTGIFSVLFRIMKSTRSSSERYGITQCGISIRPGFCIAVNTGGEAPEKKLATSVQGLKSAEVQA